MMMIRVVELWSRRTKSMHIDMVLVCFAAQKDIYHGAFVLIDIDLRGVYVCVRVCGQSLVSHGNALSVSGRGRGGVPGRSHQAPLVAWSCDGFNPIPAERQVQPSVTVSPQPSPAGELLVLWARETGKYWMGTRALYYNGLTFRIHNPHIYNASYDILYQFLKVVLAKRRH